MSHEFPMEPFIIKMTAPIKITTKEERQRVLREAGYNLFKLRSRDVMIDLLTDSGTGTMSQAQWGALIQGDEAYAGSESFYRFEAVIKEITGYKHVIPAHQGRGAENLLFSAINVSGKVVPNNTHFDTTRANIKVLGGNPVDLPCKESKDLELNFSFKGNIDLEGLEYLLKTQGKNIPCILITITNNAVGGHPVSLGNVKSARDLCQRFGINLYFDACRFSENVFLAKQRDPSLKGKSMLQIAREYFALADGCLFSAKKDALSNIGGFLALNDPKLAEEVRSRMVITEGFPTYGGLAGRDLEAIAVGLREGLDEEYLAYRTGVVSWLAEEIIKEGVAVVTPPGGHAVFVDAKRFLPHIPSSEFPGQSLACALYLEGGIRTVEIGSFMFGRSAQHELLRISIPHRVYTKSHMEHVIAAFANLTKSKNDFTGYRICNEALYLRHFTATLEPVAFASCGSIGNGKKGT